MKPLSLVIKPPFGNWSLVHGFAGQSPTERAKYDVRYRCSGPGFVRAAATGTLTLVRPLDYRIQQPELIDSGTPPADNGDTVDLYLELDAIAALNAPYWAKLVQNGIVCGFLYRGILASSLATSLAVPLGAATVPPSSPQAVVQRLLQSDGGIHITSGQNIGTTAPVNVVTSLADPQEFAFGIYNEAGPIDPATFYDDMREFVDDAESDVDDFITLTPKSWPLIADDAVLADAITQASAAIFPYSTLTQYRDANQLSCQQFRSLGDAQKELYRQQLHYRFATRIANSTQPPFEFNDDDYANIFQLEAVVEFFLNFTDPLMNGAVPRTPAMGTVSGTNATATGSLITLNDITTADLQKIVANEHFIYLPGSTAKNSRTFRILDVNQTNCTVRVHQVPNLGTASSNWSIDIYKKVDFLDPDGTITAVNGSVITLAGSTNIHDVYPNHDFVTLTLGDGTSQSLMISAFDPVAMTITTNPAPDPSATAWTIGLSPKLVLIDPFGARPVLRSTYKTSVEFRAKIDATDNTKIVLGQQNTNKIYPNLNYVNTRNYDSIYLESDTARTKKIYRINAIETQTLDNVSVRNVLTLDGTPDFGPDGFSHWQIPAGVGGQLEIISSLGLGPDAVNATTFTHGYDQYDGQLFEIHRGIIRAAWRWGSFTSRNELVVGTADDQSSMRGNKEYDYYSVRSPGGSNSARYKNFAFNVVDRYESNKTNYTGVGEARHYFADPVTADSVTPGNLPAYPGSGKTECFLHRGDYLGTNGSGSGSGGCLVSPYYYHLLHTLVQFEVDRLNLTSTSVPAALSTLLDNSGTLLGPQGQYDAVLDQDWNRKIVGTLWLIRPEEFPLNYSPPQ